jgi:uracil-DNA glycosylase
MEEFDINGKQINVVTHTLAEMVDATNIDPKFAPIIDGYKDVLNKIITPPSRIVPPPHDVLNAFKIPWRGMRVVIIGQDPYPTRGDAHGYCFSVAPGRAIPPSLRNIYGCLMKQGHIDSYPANGDLTHWAKQGVLMLNSALTTEVGKPNEHAADWEKFTDGVIARLCTAAANEGRELVFLLWGGNAHKKAAIVEMSNKRDWAPTTVGINAPGKQHVVLKWGHPSPMSTANKKADDLKNFMYCDHFTRVNELLETWGEEAISW